jgi:WD40 repeat protein
MMLFDQKHKEPKSGVELQGNSITIRAGVGTPTTINVLAFSRDSTLLAAGKDFGRVVIWRAQGGTFLRAIDTGQGVVTAVAISPDNQLIVTAGQEGQNIKVWQISDGRLMGSLNIDRPPVHSLAFVLNTRTLIGAENGAPTIVLDTASKDPVLTFPGEWSPILSIDGQTLITVLNDKIIVRDTSDWQRKREIPRLTKSGNPLAVDAHSDTLIYGDFFDNFGFAAVRLSTGDLLPYPRPSKMLKWNPSEGGFASFDPKAGLVFGHSGGKLWAWDIHTGKTCVSPILYSESGALSPDGSILVGGVDNSIFAKEKVKAGVALWNVQSILKACSM